MTKYIRQHINGLVQERHNSSVLAMELHLSCSNPSIYGCISTLLIKKCHKWWFVWQSIWIIFVFLKSDVVAQFQRRRNSNTLGTLHFSMGIDVKKIYVSSWYYFQCNSLATVKSRLTKHDICWDKNELMRPVDFLEHCSVKQHRGPSY